MKGIMNDDMVKESEIWKKPMALFFILAAMFPFVLIWNEMKTLEFVLGEAFFILIGCNFLYRYLYACKYKIIVNGEKINLKTLFKNIEIEFKDVKTYHCKRYRKSQFYRFTVFYKDQRICIYTRFKNELEELLKENKTP